ncbi:MAG: DUF4870 domain-containing protein [Sulfuricaulis sp.]
MNGQNQINQGVDSRIAMAPHLGVATLALLPFSNLLPSLLVYLLFRYRSEFIRRHALEALNFNLQYTVIYVLFRYLLPVAWVLPRNVIEFWMILCSIAAVFMAGRQKEFSYPLSIRIVR